MFKEVNPKEKFPKLEEKILKFWKRNKIFEKTLRKPSRGYFVFYEGPPTANGKPGIHHVLARVFKDIVLRYKTMKGFKVIRKAGWDTHGLPVELEVEKTYGFKSKSDIEKFGIDKFNQECKKSVWKYKKEWEDLTERIGFWIDLDHPYITYENSYIETLWWILKEIYSKGLLYKDFRVVAYCSRCQTSLSSHEVAQGYKRIKEESVYVKFKAKGKDFYFLVWTTTPWTLFGNVALAINPDFTYLKVKKDGEIFVLAKERASKVLGRDFEILDEMKGGELLELEYEPLFKYFSPNKKAFYVTEGDFVSLDEGTGIVHIAPAFGEEDFLLGKEFDLPIIQYVTEEGKFDAQIPFLEGKFVKDADKEIIKELSEKNLLFKTELYEHDYPFCWRCHTPLLYWAKLSWFIKITEIKKELIKNNQEINWIPSHIKGGRFGQWLLNVRDWTISRERYWGTPLPIWECQNENCKAIKVIGSIKELEKLSGKKIKDLHRPWIDKISFKCEKCGDEMKRTEEVIDCWFDSGAMPFAQWHWPFENKKLFEIQFPADFIAEGIDQTRGWFYTLLAISTLLEKGTPYKNVMCLGLVLDEKGRKMSKSLGNVVEPLEVINEFGVDALRWYFFTVNQPGEAKLFSKKDVQKTLKEMILTLWNVYKFFIDMANLHGFSKPKKFVTSKRLLDRWILSRFNSLVEKVNERLENYEIVNAARAIEQFVISDLSLWYVRRSKKDIKNSLGILYQVLLDLSKLLAPFLPFLTEEIYQNLNKSKSVHLTDYPIANKKLINKELEKDMEFVRKVVELGHFLRTKAKIKVRQPLKELKIETRKKIDSELINLIKEELNIKKISLEKKIQKEKGWLIHEEEIVLSLDTQITPDLKKEGLLREILRHIQELRKAGKYKRSDLVELYFETDSDFIKTLFKEFEDLIKKETLLSKIVEFKEKTDTEKTLQFEEGRLWLGTRK